MMRRAMRPVALALGIVQLFAACFRYVPVTSTPVTGTRVALEINDEGRLALAQALGPGVIRIEGTLVSADADAWVVTATNVTQLRLRPTAVDSIRVRVPTAHVVTREERKLSRSRTAMVIGGAAAALVTFFFSKGWFGRSTPPDDGGGGGGPDQYRGTSVVPSARVMSEAGV